MPIVIPRAICGLVLLIATAVVGACAAPASNPPPEPVEFQHHAHTPVSTLPLPNYALRPVVLIAGETTLGAVVDNLARQGGVEVEALWRAGHLEPTSRLTIPREMQCPLRDALTLLETCPVPDADDRFVAVLGRERLVVGSDRIVYSGNRFVARIYPVADLLEDGDLWKGAESMDERMQNLAGTVLTLAARDTWDTNGGTGSIRCATGKLLVLNIPEVQDQVEMLLAALRGR